MPKEIEKAEKLPPRLKLKRNFDEFEEEKIESFDAAQWPKYLGTLKARVLMNYEFFFIVGREKLKGGDLVTLGDTDIQFNYQGKKNNNWTVRGKNLKQNVYHNGFHVHSSLAYIK